MTLEELEALREGWEFEAKLAGGNDGRGKLPKDFWPTYSAMANTHGGQILLGARENDDGSFSLKGILDVSAVETALWEGLTNPQKVSANLLQREDVERIECEGRTLLRVTVRRATRDERPVYLNNNVNENTYLRVNDGDRKASREDVQRMLADQLDQQDARAVEDFELSDLDPESIQRYREFLAARRPEHFVLQQTGAEFLIQIGAARKDRGAGGTVRPTYAGLWMLGRESSIRELFPHWHLSFTERSESPNHEHRWNDRVATDGNWNGNLFQFYLRVIPKLLQDLQVPFALEQGLFRLDETGVHIALREAFVNTLVHADYRAKITLRVIKDRSGFEFINPGILLVSVEQLWAGGKSVARNPQLQRLFGLLQLGEREGSGGPVIHRVWQNQHWRTPNIQEDFIDGSTTLRLSRESLLPDWAVEALGQRFGHAFHEQDELGRLILITAETEKSVNHARMRQLHTAHGHDITQKFQELVRSGMLHSTGRTRATVYTAGGPADEEYSSPERANTESGAMAALGPESTRIPTRDANSAISVEDGEPPAIGNDMNLVHSDPSSAIKNESSAIKSESSAIKSESSAVKSESPAIKNESPATHDSVQQVASSRRASRALVRAAVLALCSNDFLRIEAIATHLHRNARGLRHDYIIPMLNDGLLVAQYPSTPNHPNQAYKTAPAVENSP